MIDDYFTRLTILFRHGFYVYSYLIMANYALVRCAHIPKIKIWLLEITLLVLMRIDTFEDVKNCRIKFRRLF